MSRRFAAAKNGGWTLLLRTFNTEQIEPLTGPLDDKLTEAVGSGGAEHQPGENVLSAHLKAAGDDAPRCSFAVISR